MGFRERVKELVKSFTEPEESIDAEKLTEDDVKQIIMIDPEAVILSKALSDRKKSEEEVEKGFNVTNKLSKSGFAKKVEMMNPKTEKAMRAMHNKVTKKDISDREIVD